MNSIKRRKLLQRTYGHLYKRVDGIDLLKCAYCDGEREVLDHVPALKHLESLNIKGYKRKGGKFLLYPSCEHCNSLLGATKATTFYDRLEVLSTKYEKKLNKIERWTEQELEEMGHTLRTFIQGNQCEFEYFERKLSAVEDKILKVELGELSEEGVELESTKLH